MINKNIIYHEYDFINYFYLEDDKEFIKNLRIISTKEEFDKYFYGVFVHVKTFKGNNLVTKCIFINNKIKLQISNNPKILIFYYDYTLKELVEAIKLHGTL